MRPFFFLGHPLQFIGGVAKHAVQHTAPDVFTFHIALICKGNHLLDEMERLKNVLVTGSQGWAGSHKTPDSDSKWSAIGRHYAYFFSNGMPPDPKNINLLI
jgi:hypothetical protein